MLGKYNSSRINIDISTDMNNNKFNSDHNNNTLVGNSQFPSRCNSDQPDQLPRSNHRDNSYLHTQYGEVRTDRYGNYRGVGQLPPHLNRYKSDQYDQSPGRTNIYRGESRRSQESKGKDYTPKRSETSVPKRRLFENIKLDHGKIYDNNIDVVPLDTDLEVLLINSCKIDVVKVQTIINEFMTDKDYTTIFCMTETKVEGHEFQPEGVKIFSKHRGRKDKKGGD